MKRLQQLKRTQVLFGIHSFALKKFVTFSFEFNQNARVDYVHTFGDKTNAQLIKEQNPKLTKEISY